MSSCFAKYYVTTQPAFAIIKPVNAKRRDTLESKSEEEPSARNKYRIPLILLISCSCVREIPQDRALEEEVARMIQIQEAREARVIQLQKITQTDETVTRSVGRYFCVTVS
jgi:hypothetical protein